jgi:hypothetical protein
MPSVNLRQLRDTRHLKAWLKANKTAELREGVLALIDPKSEITRPVERPDFAAQAQQIFGDPILEKTAS